MYKNSYLRQRTRERALENLQLTTSCGLPAARITANWLSGTSFSISSPRSASSSGNSLLDPCETSSFTTIATASSSESFLLLRLLLNNAFCFLSDGFLESLELDVLWCWWRWSSFAGSCSSMKLFILIMACIWLSRISPRLSALLSWRKLLISRSSVHSLSIISTSKFDCLSSCWTFGYDWCRPFTCWMSRPSAIKALCLGNLQLIGEQASVGSMRLGLQVSLQLYPFLSFWGLRGHDSSDDLE